MEKLKERFHAVQRRIEEAAIRSGRHPEQITLVAVTKTWPAETVAAAYGAGMRHFGENRAEELASKRAAVEQILGERTGITWHQIGTVQSRKADLVANSADCFHALDRVKIGRRLSRALGPSGGTLPVLLEVNLSGEASKSGILCSNWERDATQLDELRSGTEAIMNLPGLQLQGLMTMAPWTEETAVIRSVFGRTRGLLEWLQALYPGMALNWLSMGMTDDFEVAIEEGATHVRVGRAIFGSRQ